MTVEANPIPHQQHWLIGLSEKSPGDDRSDQVAATAEPMEGQDLLGAPGLRLLAQPLINAQESERQRIARDLHDVIGQALTAVKLALEAARQKDDPKSMPAALDESIGLVDQALDQVRGFARDLRPAVLDDLGLVAALRWYLDRQARSSGYEVRLEARIVGRLAPDVETACFRIVQEAMTNVARYARATHVRVTLDHRAGSLDLTIRDDGVGFELERALADATAGKSTGLLSMRERAVLTGGSLEIHTRRAGGTEIRARIPVA